MLTQEAKLNKDPVSWPLHTIIPVVSTIFQIKKIVITKSQLYFIASKIIFFPPGLPVKTLFSSWNWSILFYRSGFVKSAQWLRVHLFLGSRQSANQVFLSWRTLAKRLASSEPQFLYLWKEGKHASWKVAERTSWSKALSKMVGNGVKPLLFSLKISKQ